MTRHNKPVKLFLTAGFLAVGICAFAAESSLQRQVEQAARTAALDARPHAAYEVGVNLAWNKKVTLGDVMLRTPRRPAKKSMVLQEKQEQTQCNGVLVKQGQYVLAPASCFENGKFSLTQLTLHFANGSQAQVPVQALSVKGEVAWLQVPAQAAKQLPSLPVALTPGSQSLQEAHGDKMTSFLKQFFRHRRVVERRRSRPGKVYATPRLRVGEPLVYQGQVVALVKQRVNSYGGAFGGVSEIAFAVVR